MTEKFILRENVPTGGGGGKKDVKFPYLKTFILGNLFWGMEGRQVIISFFLRHLFSVKEQVLFKIFMYYLTCASLTKQFET